MEALATSVCAGKEGPISSPLGEYIFRAAVYGFIAGLREPVTRYEEVPEANREGDFAFRSPQKYTVWKKPFLDEKKETGHAQYMNVIAKEQKEPAFIAALKRADGAGESAFSVYRKFQSIVFRSAQFGDASASGVEPTTSSTPPFFKPKSPELKKNLFSRFYIEIMTKKITSKKKKILGSYGPLVNAQWTLWDKTETVPPNDGSDEAKALQRHFAHLSIPSPLIPALGNIAFLSVPAPDLKTADADKMALPSTQSFVQADALPTGFEHRNSLLNVISAMDSSIIRFWRAGQFINFLAGVGACGKYQNQIPTAPLFDIIWEPNCGTLRDPDPDAAPFMYPKPNPMPNKNFEEYLSLLNQPPERYLSDLRCDFVAANSQKGKEDLRGLEDVIDRVRFRNVRGEGRIG